MLNLPKCNELVKFYYTEIRLWRFSTVHDCEKCRGTGKRIDIKEAMQNMWCVKMNRKTVNHKCLIPAGVDNGQSLILRGKR